MTLEGDDTPKSPFVCTVYKRGRNNLRIAPELIDYMSRGNRESALTDQEEGSLKRFVTKRVFTPTSTDEWQYNVPKRLIAHVWTSDCNGGTGPATSLLDRTQADRNSSRAKQGN
jgi:hypothetical protein